MTAVSRLAMGLDLSSANTPLGSFRARPRQRQGRPCRSLPARARLPKGGELTVCQVIRPWQPIGNHIGAKLTKIANQLRRACVVPACARGLRRTGMMTKARQSCGPKVLVVEDEALVGEMIGEAWSDSGF